jgi:hypothetical protein
MLRACPHFLLAHAFNNQACHGLTLRSTGMLTNCMHLSSLDWSERERERKSDRQTDRKREIERERKRKRESKKKGEREREREREKDRERVREREA